MYPTVMHTELFRYLFLAKSSAVGAPGDPQNALQILVQAPVGLAPPPPLPSIEYFGRHGIGLHATALSWGQTLAVPSVLSY